MLGDLLAILLVVAFLAFIFGGGKAAGAVLASPFNLFGYIFRGVAGAAGRGLVRVVTDLHNTFYTRWPIQTVVTEVVLILIVLLTIIF